jgi:hypothetical protein
MPVPTRDADQLAAARQAVDVSAAVRSLPGGRPKGYGLAAPFVVRVRAAELGCGPRQRHGRPATGGKRPAEEAP